MAKSRPPHHPPDPGVIPAEPIFDNKIGYIMGSLAVAGFGQPDFYLAAIPASLAREMVIRHHYSHRVVNNSYCHLGVYYRRNLAGVLSFGYALNPAQAGKVVADTHQGQYLELNRMWLADVCPRNSESMAISYAIKYIRRAMPTVAWIQSFADERCGRLGVTYQAANFLFVGSHVAEFLFLDGEYYHTMLLTAHHKVCERGRLLRSNLDRAISLRYRQFRYVYFIKRNWLPRLRMRVQPYPKPPA